MLETVKSYIKEISNVPFDVFYQRYICDIQDQNVLAEIGSIRAGEIATISQLLTRLNH